MFEERAPGLRGRLSITNQVLAHAGLAGIDAELEQFTVDAGCTPKWILAAHLPNQLADFSRHRWTPGLAVTNSPGPEQSKAFPIPTNHRIRLYDHQGTERQSPQTWHSQTQNRRSAGNQFRAFLSGTLKNTDLMSKGEILEFAGRLAT